MSTVAERPATEVAAEDADHLDIGEPLFEQRERITVAQCHRMIELGIYDSDSRVELIEGVIVAKMSKNEPHMTSTDMVQIGLTSFLLPGFFLTMGNPLTIGDAIASPSPTHRSSEVTPATTGAAVAPSATRSSSSRSPTRPTGWIATGSG